MDSLDDLLGRAPGVVYLREQVRQVLARMSQGGRLPSILLEGETGTGKNLLAAIIHRAGPHRDGRFIEINAAAIPETLLEAELFGYERGAFTDARQAKPGLVQSAQRGTLMFDEIALLPAALQGKLLSVLEERTVRRLGSTRSEPVDVAIMAATNADLAAEVRAGRFRQDLYHRLAVLTVRLPALRERPDDIVLLAEHFMARACREYALAPKTLAPEARAALRAHAWPGNVRELANVMERVALLVESPVVEADVLALAEPDAPGSGDDSLPAQVETLEREMLLSALNRTRWNVVRAAAALGITRGTMRYRLEKHGLAPPARPRARPPAPAMSPAPPPAAAAGRRWEPRLLVWLDVTRAGADDFGRDFDTIVEKVEGFAGRIEEAGGARVVAVFGLDPAEDAARRAALAALAIRKALTLRTELVGRPPVGVVLHAEECPVRHVSGRAEIDADARRRAADALAALRERAGTDAILASPVARALLARRFELDGARVLGPLRELFGGPQGPFIGREAELELLRARWAETRAGRGHVVALIGEPGIGKSRLLFELRRALADEPLLYLEGRAESHGAGIPYLPVMDVLRGLFAIDERDDAEAIAVRVGDAAGADAPALLALLGAPGAGPEWQALEPAQRRARTLDALRRVLLRASEAQPVLLAIEDLHWIDTETQAFLDRLALGAPSARVLIVVTHRPEYRHAVGSASYTQVHLDPLPEDGAQALARSLLGDDPAVAPLARLLVERTEGNPFFLEETVRTLVETGRLLGERGAYHRGAEVGGLDVPPTVRAVLAARIDRLAPEPRHVLQAAAVIGREVPLALLLAVADVPEARVREHLAALEAAELLRETRLAPEVELAFRHALTHEVAYGSRAAGERRALHARVVDALERAHAERPGEAVERLAHHALAAELWDKALDYGRQAGAHAAWRSAHREAVQHFEHALGALERLPATDAARVQRLDLYLQLRWSLVPLGDYHRLAENGRAATALAEQLGDTLRLAEVSQSMTNTLRLIGDCEGALAAGLTALDIGIELGQHALEMRATYQIGLVHRQLGNYARAIEALQAVVDGLQGDLLHERFGEPSVLSAHARAWLALTLAEVGRAGKGLRLAEEGVRIAEDTRNTFTLTTTAHALGSVLAGAGDLARGLPWLERAATLAREHFALLLPHTASAFGAALVRAERVSEALPWLTLAVETAAARGLTGGAALHLIRLGRGLLAAGRTKEARDHAEHALEAARARGERGHEAAALSLLADSALRTEAAPSAPVLYAEARDLARALGMLPLVADCERALTARAAL
jgi:transcriptional regulator with AAA-type ATPase domain/predicted ATPase